MYILVCIVVEYFTIFVFTVIFVIITMDQPSCSRGRVVFDDGQRSSESEDTDGDDSDLDPAQEDALTDSEDFVDNEDMADVVLAPLWQPRTRMRELQFTKENKIKIPTPGNNTPLDWLLIFLNLIFLENICKETNRYAWEIFLGPDLQPSSRINKWKDLTVNELKKFIGIIFHMGSVRINRFNDYWKTSRFYNFTDLRKQMSRDRFLLIMRCIHFCKNDDVLLQRDSLHKVRLIIDNFNNTMLDSYYPGKELSLDESMVLWRGRLHFRQYIKGKRHKYGIKLYSLCEPDGLCLKITIYSGKNSELGGKGHAEKVVSYLMMGKLNEGHSLYMDNFYTSFSVVSKLLANKTYCTGTLRLDRKNIPQDVKSAKLEKGETIARYADGILIGKWRDKRVVTYISSEFENTMVTSTNKRGIEREKPLPIVFYNANMKGVDRHDQLMASYPCEHKSLRWYKKIFIHVLQMSMVNAYKLFRMANPTSKMSLYEFRYEVMFTSACN